MLKKGQYLVFLGIFLLFFILNLPQASANFVCGQVSSSEDVLPAWLDVKVFYLEDSDFYTTCKVSPTDNKYCCDPQDIDEVSWGVGKTVVAGISDEGYVTESVNLTVSGEGYDVFPEMDLQKAIQIHSPNQSVYLNVTSVPVDISSFSEFNDLSYVLRHYGKVIAQQEICTDCNEASFDLNGLDFGYYELVINATNNIGDGISEAMNFSVLEYINFDRQILCPRCSPNSILSGQELGMRVSLESSHRVSGTLRDYFPNDWVFVEGGDLEGVSETHNSVSWAFIDSTEVEREYSLIAPELFFAKRYEFQSAFDSYLDDEFSVVVHNIYDFLPLRQEISLDYSSQDSFNYIRASLDNPVVMDLDDKTVIQVSIFPSRETRNIRAFIDEDVPAELRRAESNFILESSILDSDLENVLVRFRIDKPFLRNVKEANLFRYNFEKEEWEKLETSLYGEDKEHLLFQAESDSTGLFAVKAEYRWGGG